MIELRILLILIKLKVSSAVENSGESGVAGPRFQLRSTN
ncbi:hypothetical protein LEP1GSC008_3974 [Leptospira kirschneri serovar Bulgarica str. Nikolaevo]|uniref:Uncharacterized protein n=1 Tax=Leptospira kirschneri serovar Bulgarica str. Nikolaevo TaxID=1240687 RepID=M6FKB2_9LEPT|nr:hypothetical protein LEP1GSC008_3974 [Leptospira kirschneri serovar Bulgarica str. Nikolaevo]